MSGDRYFIDTNVLLYTYDKFDLVKRARAKHWLVWLWENANGAVSWQVLQEFYPNAVRNFSIPAEAARELVKFMAHWNPPDVTIGLIERAWHWTDQAQVTFWDGLVVAAAERTKCKYLLSEDFQTGRQFGPRTVVNPFETSPPAL